MPVLLRRASLPAGVLVILAIVLQASPASSAETSADRLAAHIAQLQGLQTRLRAAARLAHEGKYREAQAAVGQPPFEDVPPCWRGHFFAIYGSLQSGKAPATSAGGKFATARWYFSHAEAPDLAIEAYADLEKKGLILEFQDRYTLLSAYVEVGRYQKAREIVAELLKEKLALDWERNFKRELAALTPMQDNLRPTLEFCKEYYALSDRALHRLNDILAVWQAEAGPGQLRQKSDLLAQLLRKAGDGTGETLVLAWVAQAADPALAADALLNLANMAHQARQYERAIEVWRQVEKQYPGTAAWGKAIFNIGLVLAEQKKYRQAIEQFRRLLESGVNDLEPGSSAMEAYRNYRPKAQWEIAHCLRALGDYQAALDAYRTAQGKYPFRSWCGTCLDQYEYEYALYRALCYEWLGQWDQAVREYWNAANMEASLPTVHVRLVDLYEAAGQLHDLTAALDEMDRKHLARHPESARLGLRPPSSVMRRVMEIRQWERQGELPKLVGLLKTKNLVTGPINHQEREANYEAMEAARLLARHPEQAVLLLEQALRNQGLSFDWVCYALGRCSGSRAMDVLTEAGRNLHNSWAIRSLVYAVWQAGSAGQPALDQLGRFGDRYFPRVIAEAREGRLGEPQCDIALPAISRRIRLPRSL